MVGRPLAGEAFAVENDCSSCTILDALLQVKCTRPPASPPFACVFSQAFQASLKGSDADIDCVQQFWKGQRDSFTTTFLFDILEALGALLVIPVVLLFADMFGSYQIECRFMVPAFVFSFAVNAAELAIRAGERTVSGWIAGPSWDLEPAQLRAVTLAYIQGQGQFSWLFAMDEVMLGVGLICAASLCFRFGIMPRWHGWLSLVAGILAVINFGLELGRLGSWQTFSIFGGISTAVVGFILIPIWLVTIGCYLEVFAPPGDSRGASLMDDDAGSGSAGLGPADVVLGGDDDAAV